MIGPSAGARTVGMINTVDALARSTGGNARNNMAVPTGVNMPPPTPCNTRNATSSFRLCAWPHSADARVNIANANRNTFFVPIRSPIQPDAGIQIASESR